MIKKILITILFVIFSFNSLSYAQLSRDFQYVKAEVVAMDKNVLTVKLADGAKKMYDVSAARLVGEIQKGKNVFIILPVNSNKAKSVRVISK